MLHLVQMWAAAVGFAGMLGAAVGWLMNPSDATERTDLRATYAFWFASAPFCLGAVGGFWLILFSPVIAMEDAGLSSAQQFGVVALTCIALGVAGNIKDRREASIARAARAATAKE